MDYTLVQESENTNDRFRPIPTVKVGQIIDIAYDMPIADDTFGVGYKKMITKAEVIEIRYLGKIYTSDRVVNEYAFLVKCDDILRISVPVALKYGDNHYVIDTDMIDSGKIQDNGVTLFYLCRDY